jgi:hypothetical protein
LLRCARNDGCGAYGGGTFVIGFRCAMQTLISADQAVAGRRALDCALLPWRAPPPSGARQAAISASSASGRVATVSFRPR